MACRRSASRLADVEARRGNGTPAPEGSRIVSTTLRNVVFIHEALERSKCAKPIFLEFEILDFAVRTPGWVRAVTGASRSKRLRQRQVSGGRYAREPQRRLDVRTASITMSGCCGRHAQGMSMPIDRFGYCASAARHESPFESRSPQQGPWGR